MAATTSLSERQRDELHKSILDYLHVNGFSATYEAMKDDAGQPDFTPDPRAKHAGLLEKKWTSVIRLQKKIMDLESRNAQILEELASVRANPHQSAQANSLDWLPRAPARHSLTGHRGPITRVVFHPTYTVIASASEDSTIKIWDWETGEFERTLKGHTRAVQDCDFDGQGQFLVSCSSDLTLRLWDVSNDYASVRTFHGHDHSVSSVRFLPGDGAFISASRDRTIKIWEVSTGYCTKTITGHTDWVRGIVPSVSDPRLVVSCSSDQTARVWDITTGECIASLRGHEHVVEVAVPAPPSASPSIRELAGTTKTLPENEQRNSGIAFVATGSRDKSIKIWDVASGQCVQTLNGHDNWIRALVFHPNGKYLISASDDKTMRVWDLTSGRCTRTIEAHDRFVTAMSWGRTAAQVSVDAPGALPSAAPSTQSPRPSLPSAASVNGHAPPSSSRSVERRPINVLATGSVDQTIKIWLP